MVNRLFSLLQYKPARNKRSTSFARAMEALRITRATSLRYYQRGHFAALLSSSTLLVSRQVLQTLCFDLGSVNK